jgi:hypothetical protein
MICLEFVNILRRHKIKNILKKIYRNEGMGTIVLLRSGYF